MLFSEKICGVCCFRQSPLHGNGGLTPETSDTHHPDTLRVIPRAAQQSQIVKIHTEMPSLRAARKRLSACIADAPNPD